MKVHSSSLYLDVQEDRDSDTLKSESSYNFESKISDVTDSSKCLETLQQDIDEESSLTKRLKFNSESLDPSCSVATSGSDAVHEPIDAAMSKLDPSKLTTDENCRECKLKFQDPRPENLVMYLHAFRYKVIICLYFCWFNPLSTKAPKHANTCYVPKRPNTLISTTLAFKVLSRLK